MDRWIKAMGEMLDFLLGQPASPLEKWVLLGVGLLLFILVYTRISSSSGVSNTGLAYSFLVVLLGCGLMLVAMVATRFYVLPHWGQVNGHGLLLAAMGVASLALVVPMICLVQKADYLAGLISWGIALLVAALIVLAGNAAFEGFQSGRRDLEKTKARTKEIDSFLKTN